MGRLVESRSWSRLLSGSPPLEPEARPRRKGNPPGREWFRRQVPETLYLTEGVPILPASATITPRFPVPEQPHLMNTSSLPLQVDRPARIRGVGDALPVPRLVAVSFVVLLTSFDAILRRGLYADGAAYLLSLLLKGGFFHLSNSRFFSELLTQWPIVLAMKCGVTNLSILTEIYAVSLVMVPALFWVLSLLRLIREELFWVLFLMFCISYFSAGFFAVGEYNVCYSLFALLMAIYCSRSDIGAFWAVMAVLASLFLVASYESMLFLSLPLSLMAAGRLRTVPRPAGAIKAGGDYQLGTLFVGGLCRGVFHTTSSRSG